MTRILLVCCVAVGWAAVAAAGPPTATTGGTASQATAKGIVPGGRGPARPRGEAFAASLPAKGHAVEPVLPPFTGGPSLAKQSSVELVLFSKTRPIHIRVVTKVNGKSLADAWDEHLQSLFHTFDRNGDGYLNRYEFEFIFSPAGVVKLLQGKAYIPYQDGDTGPSFEAADRDKDGRVSFAEFRAYYTEAVREVVSLDESVEKGTDYVRQSEAIFEMLDRNKDGVITADECQDAKALIQKYDKNDDEALSPGEIPPSRELFKPKIGRVAFGAGNAPPVNLFAATGKLPDSVIDLILKHYDKNKDGVLTKDEIDASLFAKLDKDADGKLTRLELALWLDGEPDLVAMISAGLSTEHCTVDVDAPNGAKLPDWVTVFKVRPGHVVLRTGGRVVEFTAPKPQYALRDLDGETDFSWPTGPDGKSVPLVHEAGLANMGQIFRVMFDHMDFDGNGVVTYAEYQKYLKLQRSTAGFPVTVSYSTRPVDLFKLLDENGDGRLSARELRTAYDKLIVLEPSGGPAVTPAALTPTATVRIARPSDSNVPGMGAPTAGPAPPPDESVPLWFSKMDLNNDGELSKKEFLGSAEHFKLLDTNGDGVISVEEAKAYEAKRKKK